MLHTTYVKPHTMVIGTLRSYRAYSHTPFYDARETRYSYSSFGASKVHFGVLNSEPLVIRSFDGTLLWILPVKNCIGLEQQVNYINKQDFEHTPSDH